MIRRLVIGALIGAVAGLLIGLAAGTAGVGTVWLILGLAERLPAGELLQIGPWSVITGLITATTGAPLGAVIGALVLSGYHRGQERRQHALVGALIGLVGGGAVTTRIWDLTINPEIALLVTVLLGVTGALSGLLVIALGRRVVRSEPV